MSRNNLNVRKYGVDAWMVRATCHEHRICRLAMWEPTQSATNDDLNGTQVEIEFVSSADVGISGLNRATRALENLIGTPICSIVSAGLKITPWDHVVLHFSALPGFKLHRAVLEFGKAFLNGQKRTSCNETRRELASVQHTDIQGLAETTVLSSESVRVIVERLADCWKDVEQFRIVIKPPLADCNEIQGANASAAFSPDGRYLVIHDPSMVIVFDCVTGSSGHVVPSLEHDWCFRNVRVSDAQIEAGPFMAFPKPVRLSISLQDILMRSPGLGPAADGRTPSLRMAMRTPAEAVEGTDALKPVARGAAATSTSVTWEVLR